MSSRRRDDVIRSVIVRTTGRRDLHLRAPSSLCLNLKVFNDVKFIDIKISGLNSSY